MRRLPGRGIVRRLFVVPALFGKARMGDTNLAAATGLGIGAQAAGPLLRATDVLDGGRLRGRRGRIAFDPLRRRRGGRIRHGRSVHAERPLLVT